MLLLIIGLILFIGLILIHEWGHFIAARRNGVGIEEYGIFFPPKLWSRRVAAKPEFKKLEDPKNPGEPREFEDFIVSKKLKGSEKSQEKAYETYLEEFEAAKGWIFSINLLPIGGFVRLKGESDADLRKGTFGAASLGAKVKIMLAGVAMNLVVAFGLLTFLALMGMPQLVDNQFSVKSDERIAKNEVLVGLVVPDSPADKAGLQVRDRLSSIATSPCFTNTAKTESCPETEKIFAMNAATSLPNATKQLAGQQVFVSYFRGDSLKTVKVQLLSKEIVEASQQTGKSKGYLGISPTEYTMKRYTWAAPIVALGTMAQFTGLTFEGLGSAISSLAQGDAEKASEQVSGPVGIFAVMQDGSILGYEFILLIVAIISLSLAIMNVLPIPALDGGKVYLTLIARLFKKRLTETMEAWLYGGSFVLLLGLLILITVVDVKRFF